MQKRHNIFVHSSVPLFKVVLSLPESAQKLKLAQLNSLFLQLSEPPELKHHLTAAAIG